MNEEQKWLTIILPMAEGEFEVALKRWREENKLALTQISTERFLVDILRTEDGKSHRRLRMKVS